MLPGLSVAQLDLSGHVLTAVMAHKALPCFASEIWSGPTLTWGFARGSLDVTIFTFTFWECLCLSLWYPDVKAGRSSTNPPAARLLTAWHCRRTAMMKSTLILIGATSRLDPESQTSISVFRWSVLAHPDNKKENENESEENLLHMHTFQRQICHETEAVFLAVRRWRVSQRMIWYLVSKVSMNEGQAKNRTS